MSGDEMLGENNHDLDPKSAVESSSDDRRPVSIILCSETHRKIAHAAREDGRSVSGHIRWLLERMFA